MLKNQLLRLTLAVIGAPTVGPLGIMSTVLPSQPVPATSLQTWSIQKSYALGVGPTDVDCPSASICFAVGTSAEGTGGLLATSDGGKTWEAQTLPAGIGSLTGVSCASTSDCWAVGLAPSTASPVAVGTTDGGRIWTAATVPAGVSALLGVDCPTTSDCWAVGYDVSSSTSYGAVIATADGGGTWQIESVPSVRGELKAVDCVGPKDCWAVGYGANVGVVLATVDGGSRWANEVLPSGPVLVRGLDSVHCPTRSDCWAGGSTALPAGVWDVVATTDGGATWNIQYLSSSVGGQILAIDCTGRSDCLALGQQPEGSDTTGSTLFVTKDGGTIWTTKFNWTRALLTSLVCAGVSECWAAGGGAIVVTSDGGSVWTAQPLPSAVSALDDVSCPSRAVCFAGGGVVNPYAGTVVASSDGGTSWAFQHLPGGTGLLEGHRLPDDFALLGRRLPGDVGVRHDCRDHRRRPHLGRPEVP